MRAARAKFSFTSGAIDHQRDFDQPSFSIFCLARAPRLSLVQLHGRIDHDQFARLACLGATAPSSGRARAPSSAGHARAARLRPLRRAALAELARPRSVAVPRTTGALLAVDLLLSNRLVSPPRLPRLCVPACLRRTAASALHAVQDVRARLKAEHRQSESSTSPGLCRHRADHDIGIFISPRLLLRGRPLARGRLGLTACLGLGLGRSFSAAPAAAAASSAARPLRYAAASAAAAASSSARLRAASAAADFEAPRADRQIHRGAAFFTASLMVTQPPFEPGTAPLTMIRPRSASVFHHL